jgi:hypothetical protein
MTMDENCRSEEISDGREFPAICLMDFIDAIQWIDRRQIGL